MGWRGAPTVCHRGWGPAQTDAVLESMPLRCSHFDAYRFFTAPATPRNEHRLSRASQGESEQPGCLHANMDLLKGPMLGPLVDSICCWPVWNWRPMPGTGHAGQPV